MNQTSHQYASWQCDTLIDWLSKAQRPTKHIIGHIGDGFLQVKW